MRVFPIHTHTSSQYITDCQPSGTSQAFQRKIRFSTLYWSTLGGMLSIKTTFPLVGGTHSRKQFQISKKRVLYEMLHHVSRPALQARTSRKSGFVRRSENCLLLFLFLSQKSKNAGGLLCIHQVGKVSVYVCVLPKPKRLGNEGTGKKIFQINGLKAFHVVFGKAACGVRQHHTPWSNK